MSKKNRGKVLKQSYLDELLPKVYQTEGDIENFIPDKIKKSLIKETNLSEQEAEKITELVVRRIISSGIDFLSGPHIREIVCSILSEQHFEEERKLYTRIGMPLMDYDRILNENRKQETSVNKNPESIHHWAANRISEEYAHLKLLEGDESKAHLYGDIHIHGLRYFDLRPNSQIWDPRMILKNGLPPTDSWTHCNKSGPASNLKVAIAHLAKWLAMTQGEFCGRQGFNFLSIFLAPYVTDLSDKEIALSVRSLIFEINQLPMIIGRQIPNSSISTSPEIFEELSNLPAVGPYGKKTGTYGDYKSECETLFEKFNETFIEGDYNSEPFNNPKHIICFTPEKINSSRDDYSQLWDEIKNAESPYFKNFHQKSNLHEIIEQSGYLNYGTLQNISINLPRISYKTHSETKFFDSLQESLDLCANILLKKYEIIQNRINSGHLPLCSGSLNGTNLLNLRGQKLAISVIGLNRTVYNLTGAYLQDNESSFLLGKKVLEFIREKCKKLTQEQNKKFVLLENFSTYINQRFLNLDTRHFPKKVKRFINNDNLKSKKGYLNSAQLKRSLRFDNIQSLQTQSILNSNIINSFIRINIDSQNGFNDILEDILGELSPSCVQFRI
ncbi:MAG: anaerobic ribonucleoside-triphosphate reductase [Promethearchaeia archaeon]